MKHVYSMILLTLATLGLCSCVNRTVRAESVDATGLESEGKVISHKRIWFWQEEFRNP